MYPMVHAVLLLTVLGAGAGTDAGVEGAGVGTETTGGDTGLAGVTGVGAGTGVGVDAMTRPVVEAMTRPVVVGTAGEGTGVEITGVEGVYST